MTSISGKRHENLRLGLTGMPGSGKRLVSNCLAKRGFQCIEMSKLLRERLEEAGQSVTVESLRMCAGAMREKAGNGALAHLVSKQLARRKPCPTVIDGIRCSEEIDHFRQAFSNFFILVYVAAPTSIRHKNILDRRRVAKSIGDVLELDQEALRLGVCELALQADVIVDLGQFAWATVENQLEGLLSRVYVKLDSDLASI